MGRARQQAKHQPVSQEQRGAWMNKELKDQKRVENENEDMVKRKREKKREKQG